MTRYTVIWEDDADSDLAEIWLAFSDHNATTAAAHLIDRELAEDAGLKGGELKEGLRVLVVSPLKAIFAVFEDDRIVKVYRVMRI